MPTYFLHLYNDVNTPDASGTELPDLDAARSYAKEMVRFEICEAVKETGRINLSHRIDIEDGDGNVLATVRFGDALSIQS